MRLVGIVGVGMVGSAMLQTFAEAGLKVIAYDKFRPGFNDDDVPFEALIDAEMVFVSVPTLTSEDGDQDLSPLKEVLNRLALLRYRGIVVSKCTTLPGVTKELSERYPSMRIVHYPEFLRAATAYEDFRYQKAAMLSGPIEASMIVGEFLNELFPRLPVRLFKDYSSTEILKYMNNCFLPIKLSFLNEFFDVCDRLKLPFSDIVHALSLLGRIGETDLRVPGPDGQRGWGGFCFPKDTKAFSHYAKIQNLNVATLDGAIASNNKIRNKDTGK